MDPLSSARTTLAPVAAARAAWSNASWGSPTGWAIRWDGLWSLAITTTGEESAYAVCNPVTVLPSPGPPVTTTTPGRPDRRAYPSAMKAAPCSLRATTERIPPCRRIASYISTV